MDYYSKKYFIGYSDVDKNNRCKLSAIVNLLQNTATLHSKTVGCGTSELMKLNYAWILLFWKIKILKNITSEMNVEVRTWYRGLKGLRALRDFEIYDESQELLAIATSSWVFYDRNLNRPIKPFEKYSEMIGENLKSVFGEEFKEKIEEIEKTEITKIFDVQRRDIDTNNHMNNERYIDYAIEVIPDDVYENKILDEIEVVYKKQNFYNEKISVSLAKITDGCYESLIKNKDGENSCMVKTYWK